MLNTKKYKGPNTKLYKKVAKWFCKRYDINANIRLFVEREPFFLGSVEYTKKGNYNLYITTEGSKKLRLQKFLHELWHVKQMESGMLGKYEFTWAGAEKKYRKMDYLDLPWEVEAHVVEELLYDLWRSSCQKKSIC